MYLQDICSVKFYDRRFDTSHRIVKMKEAVSEYLKGKEIGILKEEGENKVKFIKLGKKTTINCNLDYLINATWVVLI